MQFTRTITISCCEVEHQESWTKMCVEKKRTNRQVALKVRIMYDVKLIGEDVTEEELFCVLRFQNRLMKGIPRNRLDRLDRLC